MKLIILAITRPAPELLALFTEHPEIGQARPESAGVFNDVEKPLTLEEYSLDHFR